VDLGVDYFICESSQLQDAAILDGLANEILPAIRVLKAKTSP
jgi:hypothetical protein